MLFSSPRPPRPRWRLKGRRRLPPHPRPSLGGSKGRSAAKDGGKRLFCFAMQSGPGRHEKPVALATDLKGLPRPRRKIAAFPSLRLRRSRRSRPSAQFSHLRGPGGRAFRTAFWRSFGDDKLVLTKVRLSMARKAALCRRGHRPHFSARPASPLHQRSLLAGADRLRAD